MNLYWSAGRPILRLLPRVLPSIYSAKASPASSPICLSEAMCKPFALSRVFLLSSGGKSILLVKKKAPSHSGFSSSMYVVLKTRHVNPNIHVRRFIVHVRSPNLSATRPQLFIPARSNNLIEVTSQSYIALPTHLYWSLSEAILVGDVTYIGRPADQYRFTHPPS